MLAGACMSQETSGKDLGDVEVLGKTDKAVLVELDGEEVWIPLSQIHDDSEIYESTGIGERGNLVISRWLAHKLDYT
jgi:hypothetical protein